VDANNELKTLLRRQYEIQDAMRRPGGIRITVERELFAIRERLRKYMCPTAVMPADVRESASEF